MNKNFSLGLLIFIAFICLSSTPRLIKNQHDPIPIETLKSLDFMNPSVTSSSGDILGFYTILFGTNPISVDVVSFSKLNGLSTSLIATGQSINFNPASVILPTNTSSYDPNTQDLVCLVSREMQMLTYNDLNPSSGIVSFAPSSSTAPQFLNGNLYGIGIENGGFGTGPDVDIEIVSFDVQFALIDGVAPFQFSPNQPYSFTHESMSSATNGTDELYFVSGKELIIAKDPNPFNISFCWIDLDPTNQYTFYGLEFRSPGRLLAIRYSNTIPSLDLVEIVFVNCAPNVTINTLYNLQSNLMPGPPGWILNREFYSTTFDSCDQSYYLSTLFDTDSKSRLVEIDLINASHAEQINAQYLFGIEMKGLPCEYCTADFSFSNTDGCGDVQFSSNTGGPGVFSYSWDFGDPSSGSNNTSNLENPSHNYITCGMYTVLLTVECPDGTILSLTKVITIMDTIPPIAKCILPIGVTLDANCEFVLTAAMIDDGSSDNCEIKSLDVSPNLLKGCGIHQVVLTVTDWCNNASSCTTEIQTHEDIPPIIQCPGNITHIGNTSPVIIHNIHPTLISDNCGVASVDFTITGATNTTGLNDASGQAFNYGISNLIYTVTDSCGNTASCTTLIHVFEEIPPMIQCGGNIDTTGTPCPLLVNNIPPNFVAGNCGTPSITYAISGATTASGQNDASGQQFDQGLSTVTYTAMDTCGNVASCSFFVTVDCDSCACNIPSMVLSQGGIDYQLFCTQGGPTPVLGCPVDDVIISGFFGCEKSTGVICDETPVNWTLNGPGGFIDGGITTPFPNFIFPEASVSAPGTYTLNMSTLCSGAIDSCYCEVRWIRELCNPCCIDSIYCPDNLVPNPSFETFSICPTGLSDLPILPWTSPTMASPDYYNSCGTTASGVGVPNNQFGHQMARTGNAYVGFIARPINDYREYLEVQLKAPLLAGVAYQVSFYVSLADEAQYAIDKLGVYLSVGSVGPNPSSSPLLFQAQVTNPIGNFITDKQNWTHISGLFYANGGEDHIVIGNFNDNSASPTITGLGGIYPGAYYWIEDVSVCETCPMPLCDKCRCGTFSDMYIRGPQGAMSQSVSCDGAINIGCPSPGVPYTLSGSFTCDRLNCPPNAPLNWELQAPDGSISSIGTVQANPWFSVQLASISFTQSGVYSLIMTGQCGNEICDCVIELIVDPGCQNPCPCDIMTLQSNVTQGFATSIFNSSCKACFTPLALDDCDTVSWFVNSPAGNPVGMSSGNQSFCHTFPASGSYTVYMQVIRLRPDGTPCESFTYSQIIHMNCLIKADCSFSRFPNAGFNENAITGSLSDGGSSEGWTALRGDPMVIEGALASHDGWVIELLGNSETSDVLSLLDPICLEKEAGILSIRLKGGPWGDPHVPENDGKKWDFKKKFFIGDELHDDPCDEADCFDLGSVEFTQSDTGWFDLQLPYDLSNWSAFDPCGGVLVRPAIYITNSFGNDQGGTDNRARVQIDNICFVEPSTAVDEFENIYNIELFPNPASGKCWIRMEENFTSDVVLSLIDIHGKFLYKEVLTAGTMEKELNLDNYPSGVYFVQLKQNSASIWTSKLVIK
jgi:PKD repeat protein